MKKTVCGLLAAGLIFSCSAVPKAEAFGLGSIIGAIAGSMGSSVEEVSWTTRCGLQWGNPYIGELPSEAYRQKFSVKGTSYLETRENITNGNYGFGYRVPKNMETIVAAFNNGASYRLEKEGKKVTYKTLEIDGYTYEKDKRKNKVADDSGHRDFGIDDFYYLYGDSKAYLHDKKLGIKLPYKCAYVKVLGTKYIAEVYKFGEHFELYYLFDADDKQLMKMGYEYFDDNHKLKMSRLRDVVVFSTEIPDMSVFEIPKKYQQEAK